MLETSSQKQQTAAPFVANFDKSLNEFGQATAGLSTATQSASGQLAVSDIAAGSAYSSGRFKNFLHSVCGIGDANGQGKTAWVGRRFAIIGITWASLLPYFCVQLLACFYYHGITGGSLADYTHNSGDSLIDASTIGAWVMMVSYLGFLRSFAERRTPKAVYITRALFFLLCLFGSCAESINAALTCLAAGFVCTAVTFLGGLTRRALPDTFRFGRAIGLTSLGHAPALAICAYAMYFATTRAEQTKQHFGKVDNGDALGLMAFTAFILALPSYALARCARTSEVKPLVTLALLLYSPMFVGLLFQAVLIVRGESGPAKALSMILAVLTAFVPIAAGAALAARKNGLRHQSMLAK